MRSIKIRRYAQRYIEQKAISIYQQKIDKIKGLVIKAKNPQTKAITLYRGKVKDMVKKQAVPFLKTYGSYLLNNKKQLNRWEYIGYSLPTKGRHPEALAFTYYRLKYDNEIIYINLRVMKLNFEETIYAMSNKIDLKKVTSKSIKNLIKKQKNE